MNKLFFGSLFGLLSPLSLLFSSPTEKLDQFIMSAREEMNVPGVSVALIQGDKVLLLKGYGVAHLGTEDPVNEDTVFQLASITKSFVACGLGSLVENGALSWDDECINYLPELEFEDRYTSRYATPRDLLAHRTGLPEFGGDLLGKLGYTNTQILQKVRYIKPENSFRNVAYYSNVGYFIAGELMGRVAKKSWDQVIQSALLDPLEMKLTSFTIRKDQKNVAYGHALIDGQYKVIPWDLTGGFPSAGAITSTAKDMGQWITMLLNEGVYQQKKILKPETVHEMFTPSMVAPVSFSEAPPIDSNSGFSFGMGWNIYHYKGRQIIEKGGGLDGIRTIVTLIPELKVGIVILSNLNFTLLPEAIRAKCLELYLGEANDMQTLIKSKQKLLDTMISKPKKPATPLPMGHELSQYTGEFYNELYGQFTVSKKGEGLVVHAGVNQYPGELLHFSNDTFLLHWEPINLGYQEMTFTFGIDGNASEIQTETLGVFKRKSVKV